MTQADPSDDAQAAEDAALTRLEHKLCLLESAVYELLLAEEPGPPARGLGWARRRHRQLVKFSVIAGGLSALLAGTYGLPPQNPVRMVVDRTVTAVAEQLPDFQPQVSLLNPYLGHPAADVSQPSSSPLMVIHVSPSPTPQPSASPAAVAVPVTPPPDSASTTLPSGSGPIALPIVTSAPAVPLTSALPTASPAPSPTPTALPSSPAPSPTGGAGPSPGQQQQGKAKKPKPSPSPTP